MKSLIIIYAGFETAKELARMGGTVILACRSSEKAESARQRIIKYCNCAPSKVIVLKLDLCSLASVRKFYEVIH